MSSRSIIQKSNLLVSQLAKSHIKSLYFFHINPGRIVDTMLHVGS
ncbi:11232_t:CDS:2 [Funneliformis geosporum]|uniref:11232_t:CDS:1 n=1 Tax=Funneliformis geosporum TaxID=1117311 RepID=A0A9W4WYG3_9GLOM|nr:11232_t:CDS:2 [Funneliformis geosporum]